jgi:hypothetical protein
MLMGDGYELSNQAQDGRVERILIASQLRVVAIGCKHVLREIVGSNTEEICYLSELVDQKRRGRDFDHDARG